MLCVPNKLMVPPLFGTLTSTFWPGPFLAGEGPKSENDVDGLASAADTGVGASTFLTGGGPKRENDFDGAGAGEEVSFALGAGGEKKEKADAAGFLAAEAETGAGAGAGFDFGDGEGKNEKAGAAGFLLAMGEGTGAGAGEILDLVGGGCGEKKENAGVDGLVAVAFLTG